MADFDPITTMNAGPEESLLSVLQKIRDLQSAPLIPNNPLAQLGVALQGFQAGMTGQPNPAIAQAQQQRKALYEPLHLEAGIEEKLLGLQQKREELRRQLARESTQNKRAETREERLVRTEERSVKSEEDRAEQARRTFALSLWKEGKDAPDLSSRVQAFKSGQAAGLIAPEVNPELAAQTMGSAYEKSHDRAISLLEAGEDPTGSKWAGLFPDALRPQVDTYKRLMATAGPLALNDQRFKPKAEGDVLRAQALRLNRPGLKLSPEDEQLKSSLDVVLKLSPDKQGEVERWASLIRDQDRAAGRPIRPPFAYIMQAKTLTGLPKETAEWLAAKGIFSPTPDDIGRAKAAIEAEEQTQALAKTVKGRAVKEYNVRLGGKKTDPLLSNYSDEDVRKLAYSEDSAISQILKSIVGGGAAGGAAAAGAVERPMKNGRTRSENIAELMSKGYTPREKAAAEVDRLAKAGKL